MTLSQLRGALLEEIVLKLLENVGYKIVKSTDDGCRDGHSGLEVCGRGEWHQIDALAILSYTPAFMYPLRLLVEAKCYKNSRPVGIQIPRNSLGVLKDIQENYFTFNSTPDFELQVQRYNYHSAIFSTSSYTLGAQRFAIAHQIFLITYEHVPIMQPIADSLLSLKFEDFNISLENIESIKIVRQEFNNMLETQIEQSELFSEIGKEKIIQIRSEYRRIRGSYFGMLQGRYPMHLISEREIPEYLFLERDEIRCRIFSRNGRSWYFAPSEVGTNSKNYFELEFNLPKEIAIIIDRMSDAREIANLKRETFSFIDLSGRIGNVQRMIKLKLDENWLSQFLENVG